MNAANPTSFGIFKGEYASEPESLPDGRLLVSWAADVGQDYGLYLTDADGGGPHAPRPPGHHGTARQLLAAPPSSAAPAGPGDARGAAPAADGGGAL